MCFPHVSSSFGARWRRAGSITTERAGLVWSIAWTPSVTMDSSLAALGRNDASRPRLPAPIYSSADNTIGPNSDLAMINEVYNRRIIELAASIPRIGRLAAPDARPRRFAALRLDGDGRSQDGRRQVTDFAHEVKACALGQASSSIMAHHVVGSNADELRALRETRAQDAQGERRAAARRQMGRHRRARAGARLQGAPRLDPARPSTRWSMPSARSRPGAGRKTRRRPRLNNIPAR